MMSALVRHMVDMLGAQFQGLLSPQLQTESTIGRPVCAVAFLMESLMAWYAVLASRPSFEPPHQSTLTKSKPHLLVEFALRWLRCSKYDPFVKAPGVSTSKVALWRKRSDDVLKSDVVASKHPETIAPAPWVPAFVETPPDGAFTACALRLVRGAIKKDFRDRFEVELALFEFVLAYERWAHQPSDSSGEGQRLVEVVRSRIVASLPKAFAVDALAAEYGMSRSHFSHFFRARTGLTPARFATEVRIHAATRLLLDTRSPVKRIADVCGFANANHFCKVFRRLQHLSPAAYRQAIR